MKVFIIFDFYYPKKKINVVFYLTHNTDPLAVKIGTT